MHNDCHRALNWLRRWTIPVDIEGGTATSNVWTAAGNFFMLLDQGNALARCSATFGRV
jgi:hypothetical protein